MKASNSRVRPFVLAARGLTDHYQQNCYDLSHILPSSQHILHYLYHTSILHYRIWSSLLRRSCGTKEQIFGGLKP